MLLWSMFPDSGLPSFPTLTSLFPDSTPPFPTLSLLIPTLDARLCQQPGMAESHTFLAGVDEGGVAAGYAVTSLQGIHGVLRRVGLLLGYPNIRGRISVGTVLYRVSTHPQPQPPSPLPTPGPQQRGCPSPSLRLQKMGFKTCMLSQSQKVPFSRIFRANPLIPFVISMGRERSPIKKPLTPTLYVAGLQFGPSGFGKQARGEGVVGCLVFQV